MLIRIRFVALFLAISLFAFGQKTKTPAGLRADFPVSANQASSVRLAPPDLQKLKAEDDLMAEQARFAAPMAANITTLNSGQWTQLSDSSSVWQCTISAPGALALILLFEQMNLPEGGEIYAYDKDHHRILGPFTKANQPPSGKFTIGTLPGAEIIVEYHAPPFSQGAESILINRVDYAYHWGALADGDPWAASGYGGSFPCNVNINCPEATNWQIQKRGVARILMIFQGGSAWCSGSYVANSGGTGIPYFLTAHHCQILLAGPKFDQWAFDFTYEHPDCANGASEPVFQTVVGCERMAFRAETDFLLLKTNPVPNGYNIYYNGWSRSNNAASTSAFIHHPQGDVKKFSSCSSPAIVHPNTINWGGNFGISPSNSHWKVVPNVGIYEPGSSGCPMFDQNKRIVGQLHGGVATNCNVTAAYFGMFHLSWDQGNMASSRLKDWLDPGNTDVQFLNGYEAPPAPITISGNLKTWWGDNIVGMEVAISGAAADTVTTDDNGNFMFPDLTPGLTYTVRPISKETTPLNGVNAYDLILISRHILNLEPLTPAWKMIAADANESGTITTFDNVDTRKILLGTQSGFPTGRSWRFFPDGATFPNPLNPFPDMPNEFIVVPTPTENVSGINFFGVKLGDVDNTASGN